MRTGDNTDREKKESLINADALSRNRHFLFNSVISRYALLFPSVEQREENRVAPIPDNSSSLGSSLPLSLAARFFLRARRGRARA